MVQEGVNAQVVSVLPNKVKIVVKDLDNFKVAEEKLSVGSFLRISDSDDCAIIAIIENFSIEHKEGEDRKYVLEGVPIGFLDSNGTFSRGGNNIAIPPTNVEPAKKIEIQKIYDQIPEDKRFCFSHLLQNKSIIVPVDGDKFFSKHIAIVGSTGSGKSHTVAKILQEATKMKNDGYTGLNNSHIIIFDIHAEYKSAFSHANCLDISSIVLPFG